jgi:type I restriction enzyme, S subunit
VSWPLVQLDSIAFFQEGPGVRNWQFRKDGIKLINVKNIVKGQLITSNSDKYLDKDEVAEKYSHFLTDAGDLVMASSGATWGKTAWVEEKHLPLCMNTSMIRFKSLNSSVLDVRYLRLFLDTNLFKHQMDNLITGSAQPNFGSSHLKQIKIPLPPLSEQKRIAAILDKADSLRRKNQQAIQLADQFLRAVFLDMFGDPVTNSKKLPIKKLETLIANKSDMVDGPFGSSVNTKIDYVDNGDIPVIRTKNVGITGEFIANDLKFMTRDKYDSVKRSQVLPGDIVLTKVGTIGNVCIFPDTFKEAVLSTTGSCRIRVDEKRIDKIYFYFFLRYYRPKMHEIASAGVQSFLNMQHIKGFEVPSPDLCEQRKFSKLVKNITKLQEKQYCANMKPLFEVLSQKAFAGEL